MATTRAASYAICRSMRKPKRRREIYLDYMASTPCDPRVVEKMLPYLTYEYANPASPHRAAARAEAAVERAREQIADAIHCDPCEVYFTSGATESNNLAMLGVAKAARGNRRKVIVSAVEHKSVLNPAGELAKLGFEVVVCPVLSDGQIDLAAFADALDDRTLLVSIQLANNEIGTVQPLAEVIQLARRVNAVVHTDAAQAFGKIEFNLDEYDVDFASLSGHKCYGPKGVGALIVRAGQTRAAFEPVYTGGGQERGLRPGTLNVPAIVGFGEAARLVEERLVEELQRISGLRDRLESEVQSKLRGVAFNGSSSRRVPGCISVRLPSISASEFLARNPELACSAAAACESQSEGYSHVLAAIGLSPSEAARTIRIGIGRFTTQRDLDEVAERICRHGLAAGPMASNSSAIDFGRGRQ